jgi:hypothetical protein
MHHTETRESGEPLVLRRWGMRQAEEIATIPNDWKGLLPGFSVQPDGGAVAWTRVDMAVSEIVLVKGFR